MLYVIFVIIISYHSDILRTPLPTPQKGTFYRISAAKLMFFSISAKHLTIFFLKNANFLTFLSFLGAFPAFFRTFAPTKKIKVRRR